METEVISAKSLSNLKFILNSLNILVLPEKYLRDLKILDRSNQIPRHSHGIFNQPRWRRQISRRKLRLDGTESVDK
jgi:hypothetical protein